MQSQTRKAEQQNPFSSITVQRQFNAEQDSVWLWCFGSTRVGLVFPGTLGK
ncbi:hypothetical protein QJS04_geneDACA022417 [Acorus gramineus]|uniref:Uncharacterized protein n=1 Tax=Acorus gramineus TaxID=55184 RepID=A0AAV9B8A6_ACOGR|nr:hypothetical protein QJS04_geneDACA022417 [Acorus gramineus]